MNQEVVSETNSEVVAQAPQSAKRKASIAPSLPEGFIDSLAVEVVDEITRSFEVTVPASLVETAVTKQLDKKSASARIKGYRPGKAPKEMVSRFFGEEVRSQVVYAVVEDVITAVREREKLSYYGAPQVEIASVPPVDELKFSVVATLQPSPQISGYKGIAVQSAKHEVSDADLDNAILEYRQSKAELVDVLDRQDVKDGDAVELMVKEQFSPGSDDDILEDIADQNDGEQVIVVLGDKKLPEEFESAIPGMKVGESKVITIKKASQSEEEAQTLDRQFLTRVVKISSRQLPELNDEFVQSLNIKGVSSVDELKKSTNERLHRVADKKRKDATMIAILDKLLDQNSFIIPSEMVDEEIRSYIRASGIFGKMGLKEEDLDISLFREGLAPEAEKRVKRAIICQRVSEQESLTPSKDNIDAFIAAKAEQFNVPVDVARGYFLNKDMWLNTMQELSSEKVFEYLAEQATVEYV
jgi:trigger factor